MSVLCFADGVLAGKITGFSVPDTGKWRVFSGDEACRKAGRRQLRWQSWHVKSGDAPACVGKLSLRRQKMPLVFLYFAPFPVRFRNVIRAENRAFL